MQNETLGGLRAKRDLNDAAIAPQERTLTNTSAGGNRWVKACFVEKF